MNYSSLASTFIKAVKTYGKRTHTIDTVSIHCMSGPLSAKGCGEWFAGGEASGSSNYGIGPDGQIACYLEEDYASICTCSKANDNRAITIEVADDGNADHTVKQAAYNSLIKLLVDICSRNGIQKLLWRGDKSLIGQIDKQNMTVHRWFSSKECPGNYLYNKHGEIAATVNQMLGSYDSYYTNTLYNTTGSAYLAQQSYKLATSPLNSSIIDYTNRLTSKDFSVRTSSVECMTIHIAKAEGDLGDLATLLNSAEKAYNYGIDNDGNVGLFVDENLMTSSTGNSINDNRSVNIICMNSELGPQYPVSDSCYNSIINLCEDICRRNNISYMTYTNDRLKDNLTRHEQFKPGVNCPGPYLSARLNEICKEVNNRLTNATSSYNMSSYSADEDTLEALYRLGTISIKNTRPYVIRVDQNVTGLDYSYLKNIGVVGAMIDAGQRYDKQHNIVNYRTEKVYKQAQEAIRALVPHAFYYTTHARTILEVKEEAYWFYFVISKYPPKLGVWLHCDFDVTSGTAKKLVQKWYEYFVQWGLKSKCGLYCTSKQADLIGWPDQCTYMNLWLEGADSVKNCPDEEILIPNFFKRETEDYT